MARQYNALINLRDQALQPVEHLPSRHIQLNASPPLQYLHADLNPAELSFLIGLGETNSIPFDLVLLDEKFHVAIQAVNERSRFHIEVMQPALSASGLPADKDLPLDAMHEALGPFIVGTMRRATDEVYVHVNRAILSLEEEGVGISKLIKTQYPDHKIASYKKIERVSAHDMVSSLKTFPKED